MPREKRTRAERQSWLHPLQIDDGEFTRELPLGEIIVPQNIWIEGTMLLWSSSPTPHEQLESVRVSERVATYGGFIVLGKVVKPHIQAVLEFANLGQLVGDWLAAEEAPSAEFAAAVLRYARRWGVLELCDRNLPIGHHTVPQRSALMPPPPSRSKPQSSMIPSLQGEPFASLVKPLAMYLLVQRARNSSVVFLAL